MGKFTSFHLASQKGKTPWFLFFGVLILHLVLLPWVQNYDADSVSRILLGQGIIENPRWITSGVWAPGHFYLTTFSLLVWDNLIWAPKVLHVILGSLIVIPVFQFSKRRLDTTASIGAALFIALCPIIFRNSYHALGGIPFVLLTACALVCLDNILHGDKYLSNALWAGFFMTLAASIRYEAWMLMAVFLGILMVRREWKLSFSFACVAGVFPLLWMLGNYVELGDPLYFLEGVKIWNFGVEGVNDVLPDEVFAKRNVFFLYSLAFVLSPWILVIAFFSPISHIRKTKKWEAALLLTLPFILFFCVFTFKANHGTLLTQHRFSSTLIILFLPFLRYLGQILKSKLYLLLLLGTLSFTWVKAFDAEKVVIERHLPDGLLKDGLTLCRERTSAQLKPIPRLDDDLAVNILSLVLQMRDEGEPVVIDYISWSETFYLLLRLSEHTDRNVRAVNCGASQPLDEEVIYQFISESESALLIVSEKGKFDGHFKDDQLIMAGRTYKMEYLQKEGNCDLVRIRLVKD